MNDNTSIRIISRSMMIQFINPFGVTFYYTFSKERNINQVKGKLLAINGFFNPKYNYQTTDYPTLRIGVIFFLRSRNEYHKLDGKAVTGDTLSANNIIYCVEDIFIPDGQMIPVHHSCGRKGYDEIGRVGWIVMETLLTKSFVFSINFGFLSHVLM